jgi:hypothetical protein
MKGDNPIPDFSFKQLYTSFIAGNFVPINQKTYHAKRKYLVCQSEGSL